ncbi:MAG: CotH kinase family protein [Fibrobacterales bacterium]
MIGTQCIYSIRMLVVALLTIALFGCSDSATQQETISSSENDQGEVASSSDDEVTGTSSKTSEPKEISSDNGDVSSVSRSSSSKTTTVSSEGSTDSVEQGDSHTIAALDGESAYIFDDDAEVRTFNILIDPEALARMDAVPQDEVYEFADLVFEGDTLRDVQVRYKGSTGAWYPCTNDAKTGSPYPPGPNSCAKLSTKVKFNTEADSDRRFYGLKKLQFHHMHHYKSQLRERVVYWFHNAMGNPAPRSVHARVEINGELSGLYALVEQIDGRFTRERFEDGEGNIYKNNTILPEGLLSDDAMLFEVLKTNEDEDPTYTIWQTFEQELDDAKGVDAIKKVIGKWMDVPLLVNTVVTSIALAHWDSPFLRIEAPHHNAYWYSDTTEQKLYAIPWDVDNAIISLSGRKGEFSKGHMSVEEVTQVFSCNSPVPNKLQGHWLCYTDKVKAALDKLIDEVYPQILPLVDKWEAQIEGITQEAIDTHGVGFPNKALSMKQWRDAMADMRAALEKSKKIARNWRSNL